MPWILSPRLDFPSASPNTAAWVIFFKTHIWPCHFPAQNPLGASFYSDQWFGNLRMSGLYRHNSESHYLLHSSAQISIQKVWDEANNPNFQSLWVTPVMSQAYRVCPSSSLAHNGLSGLASFRVTLHHNQHQTWPPTPTPLPSTRFWLPWFTCGSLHKICFCYVHAFIHGILLFSMRKRLSLWK